MNDVTRQPAPPGDGGDRGPGLSKEILLDVLDATSLVFYLKDVDGRYLFVNRRYSEVGRVPAGFLLGKVDAELFPGPVAQLFRDQDVEVIRQRRTVEFEETIPLPDGVLSFITTKLPLFDERGEVRAIGGFCTEITSSRAPREDETLAAERERLSVTLRSIGEGVVSTDWDGAVLTVNHAAERLLGIAQASAYRRPLGEVLRLQPALDDPVQAILAAGAKVDFGAHELLAGAERRVVEVTGAPVRSRAEQDIGVVLAIRDVTARVRAEEQLNEARKLESLALLAGGIAHDFNNLLSTILGNLQLASKDAAVPELMQQHLHMADRAARQARALTRQLQSFARGGEPQCERTDLGRLVDDTAAFSTSDSNVGARVVVDDDLWPVEVDRAQIGQVVQNLTLNARQAMPAGGVVEISCRNFLLEQGAALLGLAPGRYVEVEVSDRGHGIPDEALARVFDPYFTTRPDGHGLGLPIVLAVVRRHRGAVAAENRAGGGAHFRVLLPAAADAVVSPLPPAASHRPRGGRVLVMDDDPAVRQTLAMVLMSLGYRVSEAADGDEAVDRYRTAMGTPDAVDLLILDLMVPGGSGGRETLAAIRAIDPNARALVASGDDATPLLAQLRDDGFVGAILKPYTIDELQEKIQAALAR